MLAPVVAASVQDPKIPRYCGHPIEWENQRWFRNSFQCGDLSLGTLIVLFSAALAAEVILKCRVVEASQSTIHPQGWIA